MTESYAGSRSPGSETVVGMKAEKQFEAAWEPPKGFRSLSAVNNLIIGQRFLVTGFIFFLLGGIQALLMRTQLLVPENNFLSAELYNQIFTMHGTTMMFLFAVPIMEAFAVYIIPAMLGTRDLTFPRLSAYGYWCYLFGGILLYSSFLVSAAPDGGWFMYTPLSGKEFSPGINQDFWLLGVTFVEIASVSGAIELIVTILRARAPGMSLNRMPIFAWYMLAVSFMIIFGFPPLILASILLEAERAFDIPFYDVTRGGDPLLWQHLFWIFGHPEVYIIFLPAAGLVSAMLPSLVGSRLVGYHLLVLAVIGTAFLSFGLWVHHMYATGIPRLALSFFAGASMAVSIPSGIQVFAWIATIWNGRPVLHTPLLFVIGFILIFVIGGLSGVMVAMVPFDWQVHDTYFVVAHFHYVLIGGMVFPLFAAFYYYIPRSTGRMLSERLGKIHFWLMFAGFNVAFFPMHLTGLIGMPRRVYTYPAGIGWDTLNLISSFGSYLMGASILVFIFNFFWHLRRGVPAGDNPWRSEGLDWANISPVPSYNVRSIPEVTSRAPLWDQEGLHDRIQSAREYLPTAFEGKREILATSIGGAEPDHVIRLPHPTFVPLFAALATAAVFIGLLTSQYTASLIGVAAFIAILAWWLWDPLPEKDMKDVGKGLRLPIGAHDRRSVGWLGAVIFLFVDATIFASLIFSHFYMWTSASTWPPTGYQSAPGVPALVTCVLLAVALLAAALTYRSMKLGAHWFVAAGLIFSVLINGGLLYAVYEAYRELPFAVSSHVYASLVAALGTYHWLHVLLATGAALFALARSFFAGVTPAHSLPARIAILFSYYMVAQGGIVIALIYYGPGTSG